MLLRMARLCGKTVPPLATAMNVRPSGASAIFTGGALTVSVAGTRISCRLFAVATLMTLV